MTETTGNNQQLADQLRQEADAAMLRRKILLCAYVALSTTSTIRAAKSALREWHGPADIRDGAVQLLTELEGR